MQRSSVDLPEPEGPMMQATSPRGNDEVDAVEDAGGAEGLGQAG